MNHLPFYFLLAWLAFPVAAASAPGDLGQGLAYFRAHELPADLPPTGPPQQRACVLDLRYARGDREAAAALETWLQGRAAPRSPVFILANTDTAPALRSVLADPEAFPGVIVIGVAARGFRPALAVQSTAENERRAYDALEQGATLASVLAENPDKVRNDEASLSKDRPDVGPEGAAKAKAGAVAPPLDATLQRAVHLHRAMRALKKI